MNKNIKRVIQGLLFILIIIAFIYIGHMDFTPKLEVDNEKFDHDYPLVNKDNVFTYVSASDVYSFLKNGSAVLFMGYPRNEWTGYYASILNDAAKEVGLKEISYYDFYDDRRLSNAVYQSIIIRLSEYLPSTDNNDQDIYAPTLIIVKNGTIIYFDNETSIRNGNIKPADYWTDLNKSAKLRTLKNALQEYMSEVK